MADTVDNKPLYEILVCIRNRMADMCRDIRALKDEIVSLYTIMGESIKTDARRESDYLHLAARVERLEQRLDERDRPPL
ncbi:MAG: hypothetical protein JOZ17_16220 [Acetobacteraceae bacterium]|nr:hypothetical protein [Acetobacteraceae bacterium]